MIILEGVVFAISAYFVTKIVKAFCGIYVTRKTLLLGYLFFIVCAAVLGYFIVPNVELDLYRHFRYNIGRYSLWKFDPFLYGKQHGQMIWEYICWFVGIKIRNNHFLPVIMVGIALFANWNLVRIVTSKYTLQSREFFLYLSVLFALVNFNDLYSGLRNTCSFSIVALGTVKMLMYKDKFWMKVDAMILFIVALLIHKSAIIPVFLFLFYEMTKKIEGKFYIIFVWSLICPFLAKLFLSTNIPLLTSFGRSITKYLSYTVIDYRIAVVLLMIGVIDMIYLAGVNTDLDAELAGIVRYLRLLHMVTLGSFIIKDLFSRMFYLIGFTYSLMIVVIIKTNKNRIGTLFYISIITLSYAAIVYNFIHLYSHISILT
ncbi:EpsG family protein [Butyrivibrio sp. NC2007]|uniref:EpsG family protein n=1 Tax=Butyrivibrio sp. NC2007 TaxID=1280683 RepID=UPI0003B4C50A|nr:EpsG family protein [Butyrivibrio sp. NC2007]